MSDSPRWLPNLVSGVSIWKLGRDLNEDAYMDGRLLIPETTGSESLPSDVRWPTQNLLPLAEARAKHPAEVANATRDFAQALERVAAVFGKPETGFHKYREAFSVPSLEADGGSNYFFDPARGKLFVIHWGATPRTLGSTKNQVFAWGDFGNFAKAAVPVAAVAAAVAPAVVAAAETKEEKKEEKKPEEEKKKRAWWWWLLALLGVIFLLLLLWWLLRDCNPAGTGSADGGVDAAADASADASVDAAMADAAADASTDASMDAADASRDAAADASRDASTDAKADAKADASVLADNGEDDDGGDDDTGGGGGSGGGGGAGGGGGSGGGGSGGGGGKPPKVKAGPAAGTTDGPHTKHFHKDAVNWRVAAGNDRVLRTERSGKRFDVYLAPGKTFDGVRVEYKDKSGTWHRY